MGIVNTTPDSFSDGGRFQAADAGIRHGLHLLDEGADWVDVGGESTRPGAAPVGARTRKLARVVPVIEGILAARPRAIVSVDTQKATVAERALRAGARVVNDVSGLRDPDMAGVVARAQAGLVVMHMRGEPRTMQTDTHYEDLVTEVRQALARSVARATAAGVPADRIAVDPGVGFGKSLSDNPRLIRELQAFAGLGHPVLIGASRKAFIGALTGVQAASERVHGSVGAALAAAHCGARILRVHDVAATVQALAVYRAVLP